MAENELGPATTPDDDVASDVSLDEEDEELIWRVFFSDLEKEKDKQQQLISNDEGQADEEDGFSDNEDLQSISSEDLKLLGDPALIERYKDLRSNAIDFSLSEEEQKRLLITNFTDDQMERFEAYRRSKINKPGIKKICNGVVGHSVSQVIATVVAGVAKSFMSEIISKSFEVQERDNKGKLLIDIEEKKRRKRADVENSQSQDDIKRPRLQYQGDQRTPLQPSHVREALRLYEEETSGGLPFMD
ncbi:TAF11 [Candida theae]|uniref:TAF11 n=1 Tax=Candida theae TaxID=1198502 RepID=A0AAD5FX87_9ASCO|nr:TAF11 [Candida theae]KAI5952964.1 TAF11 [Candida theae]